MPLIAMTREMGSLGMDVARILESELEVPLVYHEMINNLADKMRLRKSHVIRLLGGKANLFERLTSDKTSLSISRAALRADPATRDLTFAVDSDGANVCMRGIVAAREESSSAARVAMSVPGVMAVKNELRVTADIRAPMGD